MITASKSAMDFKFECKGSNGATMSSYSRLLEPSIMDSGYARGLKAGSFNYLEKGEIDYAEVITYSYGNGTAKGNSSYFHDMNLDFKGVKGISEFYGKEYFKNNRAVSAWKKIRYEDINKAYRNLGKSNMAKEIHVRSSLSMDTTPGMAYDLKYNATVKRGVVETWDASGWSNRTGARRIDWEHNALMHGDISVTNNLRELVPQEAHAGAADWLPCCYSGTQPTIEQLDAPWPTTAVIKTLEANTKLPQQNCTQQCSPNGTCTRKCENITCTPGECQGYDCIYTYDQGGQQRGLGAYNATTTGLRIVQEYLVDADNSQVIYSIDISNSGDIKIRGISVDDTLPANMLYLSSSFTYSEDGTLAEPRKLNNSDGTTTLTWSIGDLNSGDLKAIRLVAKYVEPGGVFASNKVRASGSALGTIVETTSGPATKVLDLPGGGVG
ncbi:MAG: hypothetical protein NTY37_12785 [Methanothrix sp.]|nr:hypothetical protein [Methanothrix sp.]